MDLTIGGKRIIHKYHHYIMTLKLKNYDSIGLGQYVFREITDKDISILKRGDFAIQNMLPYLKIQKEFATGFLCIEKDTMRPVGYIWVIRRGGNEMVYRVRKVEALISCVCVFREFRGRNIANAMIGEIVRYLEETGCTEVALGVRTDNLSAINAYRKAGFQITSEKKYFRVFRKNIPYHTV